MHWSSWSCFEPGPHGQISNRKNRTAWLWTAQKFFHLPRVSTKHSWWFCASIQRRRDRATYSCYNCVVWRWISRRARRGQCHVGPRVDPCFDYLECFMFPKFFESFEGIAETEWGMGVKLEREKVGDSISAKFLKVIRESVSKEVFISNSLGLKLLIILGKV